LPLPHVGVYNWSVMAGLERLMPRFSLRTLLLFTLLVTSGFGLWWNSEPWACALVFQDEKDPAQYGWISPSGDRLAFWRRHSKSVTFHDPDTAELLGSVPGHVLDLTDDFSKALVLSKIGPATVRDSENGAEVSLRARLPRFGGWGQFSPDGTKVVMSCAEGRTRIWNASDGTLLRTIKWPRGSLSPGGRFVVAGKLSQDMTDYVYDLATGELLYTRDGLSISFSPDDELAVCQIADYDAKILRTDDWSEITDLGNSNVRGFRDGGRLVLVSRRDSLGAEVRETATGRVVRSFRAHRTGLGSVGFSPDRKTMVTTGSADFQMGGPFGDGWKDRSRIRSCDTVARVWDAETLQNVATLRHWGPVWNAEYFPDGRRLLTFGLEVRVWTRRRPESSWGVFSMWELWLTATFAGLLAWSVWNDRRALA